MSDLQDIIVSSSVKAFNSGLAHGVIQERERIVKLLEDNASHYGCAYDCPQPCDAPAFHKFLALIKGELK